jgi:hypoxanthine phosphoribosyltransferase
MSYQTQTHNKIKVHDKYFVKYIDAEKIQATVTRLADRIHADFINDTPLFLCILNGSFMFSSDLMKAYKGICEISFIRLSSYKGIQTTEEVKTLIGLTDDIQGRSVIILEDIIDSGITVKHLLGDLKKYKPANLKVASLLFKPEALRTDIVPDYIGLEIPKDFIVGYGLDYDGLGRNLADIYKIEE